LAVFPLPLRERDGRAPSRDQGEGEDGIFPWVAALTLTLARKGATVPLPQGEREDQVSMSDVRFVSGNTSTTASDTASVAAT